jgi:hypothetical protein
MISGSLLLLGAEQAFAHALLVPFPNHGLAQEVLTPVCWVLAVLGTVLLVWGILTETPARSRTSAEMAGPR